MANPTRRVLYTGPSPITIRYGEKRSKPADGNAVVTEAAKELTLASAPMGKTPDWVEVPADVIAAIEADKVAARAWRNLIDANQLRVV